MPASDLLAGRRSLMLNLTPYWFVFTVTFLTIVIWESFRPRRPLMVREERRWSRHGALLTIGFLTAAGLRRIAPVGAVLLFELASCFQTFFSHANAQLPAWLERPLRWVIVTPDIHRIHHSDLRADQAHNLGDVLPWWDLLCGTYAPVSTSGTEITPGLKGLQNDRSLDLSFMLGCRSSAENGDRRRGSQNLRRLTARKQGRVKRRAAAPRRGNTASAPSASS